MILSRRLLEGFSRATCQSGWTSDRDHSEVVAVLVTSTGSNVLGARRGRAPLPTRNTHVSFVGVS